MLKFVNPVIKEHWYLRTMTALSPHLQLLHEQDCCQKSKAAPKKKNKKNDEIANQNNSWMDNNETWNHHYKGRWRITGHSHA